MKRSPTLAVWTVLFGLPLVAFGAATGTREYEAALRSKADSGRGETIYTTCAACHGATGAGTQDGSVPAIGGQHFKVLVRQLVDYRHDSRWDPRMAQFTAKYHLENAQAIADVGAYISQLDGRWESNASNEYPAHGAAVYLRLCSSCHGDNAQGNQRRGIPRLRGQHYEYLVRQMHDSLEERRSNLSRTHIRLLEPFDRADILGVAGYLSTLPPAR
jgi:cytochrome c553